MSTRYTRDDYTPDVLPKGLHKDVVDAITIAVAVGWTVEVKHIRAILRAPAPNEHQSIPFSASAPPGNMQSIARKIDKYANPLLRFDSDPKRVKGAAHRITAEHERAEDARANKKAEAEAKKAAKEKEKAERLEQRRAEAAAKREAALRAEAERKTEMELAAERALAEKEAKAKNAASGFKAEQERRRAERGDTNPRGLDEAASEGKAKVEQAENSDRFITHEGPMIARRAQGKGYLSETTIERQWSDGTADFKCAYPECTDGPDGGPFISAHRLGIRGHWLKHVNAGEVQKMGAIPEAKVEIPPYEPAYERKQYTPRVDRVRALKRVLLDAIEKGLDWSDPDAAAETLAAEALAWSHEQSSSGSGLAAEREPLSAEQMLERIRTMLDNGEYLRQRDEIADLRTQMAEMGNRLDEVESERDRLKDERAALRDLLADEGKKEAAS